VALVGAAACGSSDADPKVEVAAAMQKTMQADLTTLHASSQELCAAAPQAAGRGWDATLDATNLAAMKAAWIKARTAYEHVEGATAPVFSDLDASIDERYDGFLADEGPDTDLFDDQGVTGLHAIERILYVDVTPAAVVAFEKSLPGYVAARFPATEQEASSFKNKLCARLVTDTASLLTQWTPKLIDVSGAFTGLIGLAKEQQEKVNKAATGEEESRYSQRTMADLRANLEGTRTIYGLFRNWLRSKTATTPTGAQVDEAIEAGFTQLAGVYASVSGDAIPQPPATWSAETPSSADLATPFGTLYEAVRHAVDPKEPTSIVAQMNQGANLLGVPVSVEE